MSFTNERFVKRSRKVKTCALCGDRIQIGDPKFVRVGVWCGDFGSMHMHPECHGYEPVGVPDEGWYDDISDAAFDRADAIKHAASIAQGTGHSDPGSTST